MKKLRKEFEKDLALIDKELEIENNPYYDLLVENIDTILTIASDQQLKLNIPKNVMYLLMTYKEKNSINNNFIKKYYNNKDFNLKLSRMYSELNKNFNYINEIYTSRVSEKDAIKIVGEFFKTYDKDIYDFYENYMINGRFYYLNNIMDYLGLSIEGDYLLEPYLFLAKENNIFNITILAHEMIHIYVSQYFKELSIEDRKKINNLNLREVYAHFIELLSLDYLEKIGFNERDIKSYKNNYNYSMIEILAIFNSLLEKDNLDFTNLDDTTLYHEAEIYSYGKVFSYHYYDKYYMNKEETKNNLLNLSIDSKNHSFDYVIKNYGLNEEELTDSKKLIKYLK